tara:strand:- start:2064 stop:2990 length:927 start_codon:yes stop_codon:yes gene_type:complete
MATTTSITSTYAGEFAGKYISSALLSADTLDKGLVEIKPNVKYKEVVKKVATNDIVADATCDFSATSTVTLTERILQPEEFQVNLQLCKKDFRSDWEAVQMGYSAYDNLPANFSDFLIGHVAAKVAQKTEQTIWSGANATAGEFDGFTALMTADGDVNDVTGTTVDAANVIAELGKVADAIPNAIYGKEDLTIYVPQNVARAYVRALGGFGASGLGANGTDNKGTQWFGNEPLFFDGIRVAMVSGLAANTMVAAEASNLYFGTGLLSDHNEVKLLDMGDLDGSQNVRVIMRYTAGVQYGIGADCVLYS